MSDDHSWAAVTEDTDPRTRSPHDDAVRAAYRSLLEVAPDRYADPEAFFPDLLGLLETQLRSALEAVDAELGPFVGWRGAPVPDEDYDWAVQIRVVDFDTGDHNDTEDPDESMLVSIYSQPGWDETGYATAARAYRRECRWDFAPGEAGVWVIAVAPYGYSGGGDLMTWRGNLVGFVILMDRDKDQEYESLAHLWTATGWRRRGISTALVEHARKLFPLRRVEGPVTEKGRALLTAATPELLTHPEKR